MEPANGTSSVTTPKFGDMRDYRAPSLLQPHRARQAIRDAYEGRRPPLIGYFLMLCNPQACKVIAQMGFDMILIDLEHSPMNIETMANMVNDIQHISEGKTAAWVRVSGHDHDMIGYALDCGASLMIPQITNVAEAREALSATKFGVKNGGTRSVPPARFLPGLSDGRHDPSVTLWESQNQQAAVLIQLESEEGIRNLDEILTECGDHIDACFVGYLDLRASMGLSGPWGNEPEFKEILQLFDDTLVKHNMPRAGGAFGTPEMKKEMGSTTSVNFATTDLFALLEVGLRDLAVARESFLPVDLRAKQQGQVAKGVGKALNGAAHEVEKNQVV